MKKSRMVMEFDPYGTLIMKSGNHIILILFHLYCGSKHKLSAILIYSHVSILIQNIVPAFCTKIVPFITIFVP